MAEFKKLIITTKGQTLMAKMIAGTGNVKFTKIAISDTTYTDGQLEALTALSGVKQTTLISKVVRTNNVAIQVEGATTNTDLVAGYYMRAIGLYALDPQEGEILYAVTNATQAGYMPPYNGITVSGAYFKLVTTVSNASNVSLNVDPAAVATIGDIADLQNKISDLQAFVGYTDADIYGVEVDFKNKVFTRLAGAVNKTPGAMFDGITTFGGRKRCIVTDTGKVLAYFGEAAYTETGALLQAVTKGGTTYAIGTAVQVMVEQPKFYYKVVPLQLDKVAYNEVNTIAVTAVPTADGNVTINLDGKDFTVAVTTTDNTTTLVATKIRAAAYTGWTTGGSGASVTFTSTTTGEKVTATFNGGTTGVTATVTKTVSGKAGKGFHMRKARYYVSDVKKSGFKLHPAFIHNGKEKNFIYLSAFEGSLYDVSASAYILNDAQVADFTATTGDKLCSIANAKPISGSSQDLIRSKTRILANNRGTGWQQAYAATIAATQMLFMIEYASFNTQTKIGVGNTNKPWLEDGINYAELTGATTNLGNTSGAVTNVNGINIVTYRGEENWWGNIWKWVDGLNIYGYGEHSLYVADNGFTDNINTSPYKDAGITIARSNGYISAFAYNEDFDWLFFTSETTGDSSLPVGDYFWQNHASNSWFVARLGGYWGDSSDGGGFDWSVFNDSSSRSRSIGGRLVYVPDAA
ncbi:phage tail protein [Streptococcus parasuis]|uniref:phage tail-collar fiber domain-containing protein n=1 Tax=Streptococcus parasuis TaxID=1501662 RepID=UPI00370D253C